MPDHPCPKCSGLLRRDSDKYGEYDQCWQCGYLRDLAPKEDITRQVDGKLNGGAYRKRPTKQDAAHIQSHYQPWAQSERFYLQGAYRQGLTILEMAEALGRSTDSVQWQVKKMGLRRE